MTVMAVRPAPSFTSIDWPIFDRASAGAAQPPARTRLEAAAVSNSILRDVLTRTEQMLSTLPAPTPNLRIEIRLDYLGTTQTSVQYTLDLVGPVRDLIEPLRWSSGVAPGIAGAFDRGATSAATGLSLDGDSDVVGAIRWVAALLDVPDVDVLAASKIKQRNWHNWQNGKQARLSTQGRLWSLVHTVRSLHDLLGDDVAAWLRQGGEDRRELLRAGEFDTLLAEAATEQAMNGRFDDPKAMARRASRAAGALE